MKYQVILLVIFIASVKNHECLRILFVSPIATHSHMEPQVDLAKALANRGHNITFLGAYEPQEPVKNVRNITIIVPTVISAGTEIPIFDYFSNISVTTSIHLLIEAGLNSTEGLLQNTKVRELLENPTEMFDIVIVENFMTFALQGFCYHFKAHCILFTAMRTLYNKPLMGYIPPLQYISEKNMEYSAESSFFQKMINIFSFFYMQFQIYYNALPEHDKLLKRYFKETSHITDIIYNTSLILQNSHISFDYSCPEAPNIINIGGFHIKENQSSSNDIKDFLDSSPEGVIYMSFGSILKSVYLPPAKIKLFLKVFSKFNMKVLWKHESGILEDKPEYVKIVKWAPQQYILGHPNVKLFISHGGIFSTIEAVYFGKPVFGIPIYYDQTSNLKYLEEIGMGKFLPYYSLTEENLEKYLEALLKNSSFTKSALKNSKLLLDQLVPPMEKAIFWIEYIHRNGGGLRLRLAGLNLPFYKLIYADVVVFILCTVLLLMSLFIAIFSKLNNSKKQFNVLKRKKIN